MVSIIIVNVWRGCRSTAISLWPGCRRSAPSCTRPPRSRRAAVEAFWYSPGRCCCGDHGRGCCLGHPDLRRFQLVLCADRRRPANATQLFATYAYQIGVARVVSEGAAISLAIFPVLFLVVIVQLLTSAAWRPTEMIEGAKWRKGVLHHSAERSSSRSCSFYGWRSPRSGRNKELYRPLERAQLHAVWTTNPTLRAHLLPARRDLFSTWMLNTDDFIALVSTAISLFCGLLAGYALSRLKFRRRLARTIIFITYLVPQTLLFHPARRHHPQFPARRHAVGADPDLPDLPDPVLHLADDGLLQGDPEGNSRSARARRRSRFKAMIYIILPDPVPRASYRPASSPSPCRGTSSSTRSCSWSSPEQKTVPVGVTSELIRGDVFFWGPLMRAPLLGSTRSPWSIPSSSSINVAGLTGSSRLSAQKGIRLRESA